VRLDSVLGGLHEEKGLLNYQGLDSLFFGGNPLPVF
jgi:hypothetical protein